MPTIRDLFKSLTFKNVNGVQKLNTIRSDRFISKSGILRNEFGTDGRFTGSGSTTLVYNGEPVNLGNTVSSNGSIQDMINDEVAKRNSISTSITINVRDGTYSENLSMPQNCAIIGSGNVVIDGDIETTVSSADSPVGTYPVILRNLEIQGTITHNNVEGASRLIVDNCKCSNANAPIFEATGATAFTETQDYTLSFNNCKLYGDTAFVIDSTANYKHLIKSCVIKNGTRLNIENGSLLLQSCHISLDEGLFLNNISLIQNCNIYSGTGSPLNILTCDVFNTTLTGSNNVNYAVIYPDETSGTINTGGLFLSNILNNVAGANITETKYFETDDNIGV